MEKIYKGEIQRLLPIFQTMADGKTIQTKNGIGWIDIDGDEDGLNLDLLINYQDYYRIKPEVKYRPFKDAEECWNEMYKHQPFGWTRDDFNKIRDNITRVTSSGILYGDDGDNLMSFEEVFNKFKFADGAPFGIKVEE